MRPVATWLLLFMSVWSSSRATADDQQRLIAPKDLASRIGEVIGGQWAFSGDAVSSANIVVRKGDQERHLMFFVFYAPCQQDQACVLRRFESWQRPLAVVWGAEGWTVISDPDAWTSDDGLVGKLVALLAKYRPDPTSWKMGRQLVSQEDKQALFEKHEQAARSWASHLPNVRLTKSHHGPWYHETLSVVCDGDAPTRIRYYFVYGKVDYLKEAKYPYQGEDILVEYDLKSGQFRLIYPEGRSDPNKGLKATR